jgi:hypothetical protein
MTRISRKYKEFGRKYNDNGIQSEDEGEQVQSYWSLMDNTGMRAFRDPVDQ